MAERRVGVTYRIRLFSGLDRYLVLSLASPCSIASSFSLPSSHFSSPLFLERYFASPPLYASRFLASFCSLISKCCFPSIFSLILSGAAFRRDSRSCPISTGFLLLRPPIFPKFPDRYIDFCPKNSFLGLSYYKIHQKFEDFWAVSTENRDIFGSNIILRFSPKFPIPPIFVGFKNRPVHFRIYQSDFYFQVKRSDRISILWGENCHHFRLKNGKILQTHKYFAQSCFMGLCLRKPGGFRILFLGKLDYLLLLEDLHVMRSYQLGLDKSFPPLSFFWTYLFLQSRTENHFFLLENPKFLFKATLLFSKKSREQLIDRFLGLVLRKVL